MKTFKDVVISSQEVSEITCDKCGKTYKTSFDWEDIQESQEFLSIDYICGYGSIFGDMNKIRCDLCQYCVKELLGKYLTIIDNDVFGGI